MTYYADLTRYEYSEHDGSAMLNVGWLAGDHGFPTGDVEIALVRRLTSLAADCKNVMRGLHDCELCDVMSPIAVSLAGHAKTIWLGTGEIHVPGAAVTYAAPTLVVHYIEAHRYLPPSEFLDAVRAGTTA